MMTVREKTLKEEEEEEEEGRGGGGGGIGGGGGEEEECHLTYDQLRLDYVVKFTNQYVRVPDTNRPQLRTAQLSSEASTNSKLKVAYSR